MDPPKIISLRSPATKFSERLGLTLCILALNGMILLGLIYVSYWMTGQEYLESLIRAFKNSKIYGVYFSAFTLEKMLVHLWSHSFVIAIAEEFIFRYPVLILMKNKVRLSTKNNDYTRLFMILMILSLNLIWTSGYPPIIQKHPIPLPIFTVGLLFYWLTAKTQRMWPTIFCHTASNFGLYIIIQYFLNSNNGGLVGQILRVIP